MERQKGALSSIPITTILKIIVAILVVSAMLAIFIPLLFQGTDAACQNLKAMVESFPGGETINQYFNLINC